MKIFFLLIFIIMPIDSNTQVSINRLITKPDELEIIELENFEKGSYLDILRVKRENKKSEVKFVIDESFEFNQFIISVSPKMDFQDTICVFCEVNDERYYLGNFSPTNSISFSKQNGGILVDVDVLKLDYKISKINGGVVFLNSSNSKSSIKLINLIMTDTTKKNIYKKFLPRQMVKLNVPKISQMTQQVEYNQDICSPTSLSMVFGYYGVKIDTVSVACSVYDNATSIYGNWIFNTAYASYLGFYAFVARINSFEMLYKILDAGVPVVASISFGPGELKKSPIKKTKGHLVVIKGIDNKGNIIVNDPAASVNNKVEIVYDPVEFFKAWIENKYGTSYIIADEKRIRKVIDIFRDMEER